MASLNIPPIYRVEFYRTGDPPGKLIQCGKKIITTPLLLARIRELLNSEVEEVEYYEEPPEGDPTYSLLLFTEHSLRPITFEFKTGGAIINEESIYLYLNIQHELWEIFEKEMFGRILWSPA